jgi:hypothetical protein
MQKIRRLKNPAFIVPVDLPGVKPEDYPKDIASGNGSAAAGAAPARRNDGLAEAAPADADTLDKTTH